MGSNKSNANSSMGSAWKAVQNGTNSSTYGNDEDDASGMAWVKKRKAAREKAKLEADKMETQGDGSEVADTESKMQDGVIPDTPQLPKEDDTPRSPVETPAVAPADQPHGEPKHITTAINLPPHRAHKREPSFGRVPIPQVESPTKEKPINLGVFDMDAADGPEGTPIALDQSAGSTTEDEEEEEDSSIDEDEDDSDAYSEENAHSKTALGAGVEKVSRHKDTPPSKTQNLPHSSLKNPLPITAIEA